jgi:hypothetical protein
VVVDFLSKLTATLATPLETRYRHGYLACEYIAVIPFEIPTYTRPRIIPVLTG